MDAALLIDFGSTYTKLTAVDLENEEILATAKDLTTVQTDIMIGFKNAFEKLKEKINLNKVNFVEKLACSSAAGGLKMVAIGLVPELTAEAAKRAALGAGARILGVYSFELTKFEIEEIIDKKPDIILLAGGTNGGNKDCIIHNAKLIAKYIKNVPIVVAGNKNAQDEISDIFNKYNIYYKITENVMPKLNQINVEPARKVIREIFMKKIVEAKGMKRAEKFINSILMPTPAAVLKAAKILADGTDKEGGIGELIVVDIGGATTDVHSIASGEPSKAGVTLKGLPEPYAKRTVEGDLGMRVSAVSLLETAGIKRISKFIPNSKYDIEERCKFLQSNISFVPKNEEDLEFDESLGMVATEIAMERHVGTIECLYTPLGAIYSQVGKDLLNVKYLIGTGGVIVHSKNPEKILSTGKFNPAAPNYLKPVNPEILVDKEYILSAMGLLAEKYPDKALRIIKKYIVKV
ncbi:methylaspartate mutase accessory protein GlmL [Thermovenabulum sp.]|uniref:methylaspartate mutase accessory protein GlmL n=1 Tax=Thermovenabulum sp. TaxID=3100335 RepID=UPI003C79CE1B